MGPKARYFFVGAAQRRARLSRPNASVPETPQHSMAVFPQRRGNLAHEHEVWEHDGKEGGDERPDQADAVSKHKNAPRSWTQREKAQDHRVVANRPEAPRRWAPLLDAARDPDWHPKATTMEKQLDRRCVKLLRRLPEPTTPGPPCDASSTEVIPTQHWGVPPEDPRGRAKIRRRGLNAYDVRGSLTPTDRSALGLMNNDNPTKLDCIMSRSLPCNSR